MSLGSRVISEYFETTITCSWSMLLDEVIVVIGIAAKRVAHIL